jgi:hypothetical protein
MTKPKTCPHCGVQTHSPFPWNRGKVIHDVDSCGRIHARKAAQQRRAK